MNINIAAPKIRIKTEDGEEPCACAENEELKRNLKDFQGKYFQTMKLLKIRDSELDILKNTHEILNIE